MAHVAETLHQCESGNVVEGGWVGGNVWFGSIPCVVELKKQNECLLHIHHNTKFAVLSGPSHPTDHESAVP
jgi:hypothetical protein